MRYEKRGRAKLRLQMRARFQKRNGNIKNCKQNTDSPLRSCAQLLYLPFQVRSVLSESCNATAQL